MIVCRISKCIEKGGYKTKSKKTSSAYRLRTLICHGCQKRGDASEPEVQLYVDEIVAVLVGKCLVVDTCILEIEL